MHKEILNQNQIDLLPLISSFKKEYYLVGGTAIALYIGHRRSIDFDLFKFNNLNLKKNLTIIESKGYKYHITRRVSDQLNITINDVKITFFQYPFKINAASFFEQHINLPSLLDLGAMKAYALGRRSKWKDYVDMYFILKNYYSINEISQRATELFDEMFSAKLFRSQLSYFEDIDFSEEIEYIIANPPSDEEIRQTFIDMAVDIFD